MTPLISLFASLCAASAGGIRVGLPLLLIVFISGAQAESGLGQFLAQPFMLGILFAWTLIEVVASKTTLGQRVVRLVQFGLTPIVAGLLAAAFWSGDFWSSLGIALLGALIASIFQLVQSGFLFRTGPLPSWASFLQDGVCGLLLVLACYAPEFGAGVMLSLLLLALRQAQSWRRPIKPYLLESYSERELTRAGAQTPRV
jgi:Domain of unknown function (DUF4126)